MEVKYKVLKDFQLLTNDKKIITLKAKSILVNGQYITKSENIEVDLDVLSNNPEYFQLLDWREELNNYLKSNKIPQPAILTKKLSPFIEDLILSSKKNEVIKEVIKEVIREVPSENEELKIELENKIKKNEILENHLKSKIDSLNNKEMNLDEKIKELKIKEMDLENNIEEIGRRESELLAKEAEIRNFRENPNDYINRNELKSKIEETMANLISNGYLQGNISGQVFTLSQFVERLEI